MGKCAVQIAPPDTAEQSITQREFLAKQTPQHDAGFINEATALSRVPVSRRTWYSWRRKGLPYIRLPGSRRVLYDWGSVRQWLLRQQRGE